MKSNFSVLIKLAGVIISFHAMTIFIQLFNHRLLDLFVVCITLIIYSLIIFYIAHKVGLKIITIVYDNLKSILLITFGVLVINSIAGGLPKSIIDTMLYKTINPIYCNYIIPKYKAIRIDYYNSEEDIFDKPTNEKDAENSNWNPPYRTKKYITSMKDYNSFQRNEKMDISISHFWTWHIPYSLGYEYKEEKINKLTYYAFYPIFLLFECLFLSIPYVLLALIIFAIRLVYQRFKIQDKLSEQL